MEYLGLLAGLFAIVASIGARYAESWPKRELAKLEKLSTKGDADAMLRLGVMYTHGYGVEQNLHKAREWYAQLAKHPNEIYAEAARNELSRLNYTEDVSGEIGRRIGRIFANDTAVDVD